MTTYGRPDFNNDDLESSFRYYGEFHVRQPVSGWSKTEKERLAKQAKNQISPKMLDIGSGIPDIFRFQRHASYQGNGCIKEI